MTDAISVASGGTGPVDMIDATLHEETDIVPAAPQDLPLEQTRLREAVRAELFGSTPQPTYVGRFRLLECIGRGGMGVVWSAHDDELDRKVAIKLLRPELGGDALGAEARALAKLAHPNVVGVFDVGIHDGQRFFAMEYVEGETLRAWLSRPHPLAEVVDMFVGAGRGLAAAHAVGLVHRDFKPDNVLVSTDGRPRVLDFGLARAPAHAVAAPPALEPDANPRATAMSRSGDLLGTPTYMAPEQHLGEGADARSDQFAFGVALFEAIAGTVPFMGEDLRTLSLAIVRGKVDGADRLDDAPRALRRIIHRALQVDPRGRFADMTKLLAELQSALHEGAEEPDDIAAGEADDVLARAVQLQASETGRAGLSLSDLEEVGAEVGVSPSNIRRALAGGPTPASPAASGSSSSASSDVMVELRASRPIDVRPTVRLAELVVRELQRTEGPGHAAQIGGSLAWTGRDLDAQLDPTAFGGTLALRRRERGLAQRRAWAHPLVGGALAAVIAGPVLRMLDRPGPREDALLVGLFFVTIILGALVARQVAQLLRARELASCQRRLEATADRLAAFVEGYARGPRS